MTDTISAPRCFSHHQDRRIQSFPSKTVSHPQFVYELIQMLKEAQIPTEAELKCLEQAILDRAFRGELVMYPKVCEIQSTGESS
ncbi:hypothetical protein AS159_05045 [Thermotoga sp. Ku-13t]|nr:hypothetical protein AS159_05045 [Thermotoga sp. Ku-13t]